jgi:hypothetical protein
MVLGVIAGPSEAMTRPARPGIAAAVPRIMATPETGSRRDPRFEEFPIELTQSEFVADPGGLVQLTCGGGDRWIRRMIRFENRSDQPRGLVFLAVPNYGEDIEAIRATAVAMLHNPRSLPAQDLEVLGGPGLAPAGGSSQALIDFRPGLYAVLTDDGAFFTLLEARFELMMCASGDFPGPDVNADGMVVIEESGVDLPQAPIGAGSHLWEIANFGRRPNLLHFIRVPGDQALDVVRDALTRSGRGPEPPTGFVLVGGVSMLSPGNSVWIPIDLAPGSYVAFVPATGTIVPFDVVAI